LDTDHDRVPQPQGRERLQEAGRRWPRQVTTPPPLQPPPRWVGLDELHEPAHRLLMLLHAWAGDRPGSIQASGILSPCSTAARCRTLEDDRVVRGDPRR
jgi:hypothetical protein